MSFEVEWSDEAKLTYLAILEYLSFKWSERSVHNFNKKAFKVIEMISHHTNIYKLSEFKSIHKAVITKQTSLFYSV